MAGAAADRDWLHAGRVGRPHGLDGSFLVTDPNAALLRASETVRLGDADLTIVRLAGHDRRLILRIDGCSDREAAEALRGQTLLVSRTSAPQLEADEWWAEDLEGLAVCDGERKVGTVSRLLALPSCEVLEVQRAEGGDALLVPLVSDAVRQVDIEHGRIDIDLEFLGEA
ncbi:MAG TPA: ribosome maturation factor RimM [Solirubrobacteraceae bacterium]|nr:ribosome maturation factor RimM [Solirubrobacteraceae bacterium]